MKTKEMRGITLISLVVMIIVLLILSGITITMLSSENGILKSASKSKEENEYAGIYEAISMELQNYKINKTLEDVETCKDYFSQALNLETTGNNNDFYCIYKNYLVRIDGEEQKILSIDKLDINTYATYSSIYEMKKDVSLKENLYVRTLGYYSEDIGGSAYYKIINNSGINLDEKKYIALDNGLCAMLYPINNKIDLKQVGAYGNGVNDETEILNYAFSNFDNIYIPKGKYIVNNKVKVTKKIYVTGSDNTEFIADFDDSFIEFEKNVKDISFESIIFDGINNRENREFLKLYGNNINIKNCTFNNSSMCIYLNGVNNYNLVDNKFYNSIFGIRSEYNSENGKITSNEIYNNVRTGIDLISNVNNVEISKNNIYDNGGTGIECNGGVFTNFSVKENYIANNGYGENSNDLREGINFHGAKNTIITKNKICGNASNGIDIDGTNSNSSDYRSENVTVSENYIEGNSKKLGNGGIIIWSSKNINIEKNTLLNNYNTNITIGSEKNLNLISQDISIDSNQMKGILGNNMCHFIYLQNAAENIKFNDNQLDAVNTGVDRRIIMANGENNKFKNLIIGKNSYSNFFKDNVMYLQNCKNEINPINITNYESKEYKDYNINDINAITLNSDRNMACWLKSAKIVCMEDCAFDENSSVKIYKNGQIYVNENVIGAMKKGEEKTLEIQQNGSISVKINELDVKSTGLADGKFKIVFEICYDIPMYY